MESSFDSQLRKKLEGIMPEEAGLTFDREKVWEKINSRSHKKVLPFRTWATHAAAVVAGILIAGYFISRHENPVAVPASITARNVPAQSETKEKVPAPKVNPAIQAPLLVKSNLKRPRLAAPVADPQPAKTDTEAGVAVLVQERPPVVVQELIASAPSQKGQRPNRVLHLADMNNENGAHKYAESKPESLLARLAGREETKEQDSEMLSALISNYVTNKKFK